MLSRLVSVRKYGCPPFFDRVSRHLPHIPPIAVLAVGGDGVVIAVVRIAVDPHDQDHEIPRLNLRYDVLPRDPVAGVVRGGGFAGMADVFTVHLLLSNGAVHPGASVPSGVPQP